MTTAIEPSADEIERVAKILFEAEHGTDYYLAASWRFQPKTVKARFCKLAVAAILAMDRRAEVVGKPDPIQEALSRGQEHGLSGPPSRDEVAALLTAMMSTDTTQPSIGRTSLWILAKQYLAALASPPAPAVAVKLLEWKRYPDDGSRMTEGLNDKREFLERAITPWGPFFVMVKDGVYSLSGRMADDDGALFGTADAAKEAAQSGYERRIRSALVEPAPQLSGNTGELPAPAVAVPEGMQLVPIAALKWLYGEGVDDNGRFFGETPFEPGRRFQWRADFRRMCAAAPEPPATRSEEPFGYTTEGWIDTAKRKLGCGSFWIEPSGGPTEVALYRSPPATRPEAEIRNEVRTPITIWMKSRMADELNKLGIREGSYDLGQDILTRVLAPEPPATAIRALKEPGDEH